MFSESQIDKSNHITLFCFLLIRDTKLKRFSYEGDTGKNDSPDNNIFGAH